MEARKKTNTTKQAGPSETSFSVDFSTADVCGADDGDGEESEFKVVPKGKAWRSDEADAGTKFRG
jgi:hypothetical protein